MKAQAAIEYLATYGFALFVIVVVLAILVGMFRMVGRPELCVVEPQGFTCGDVKPLVTADEDGRVSITFRLANEQQQTVHIQSAVCAVGKNIPENAQPKPIDKDISWGGYLDIEDVPCYSTTGSRLVSRVGQEFSGLVEVYYNYENDFPNAKRVAKVYVNTKISENK